MSAVGPGPDLNREIDQLDDKKISKPDESLHDVRKKIGSERRNSAASLNQKSGAEVDPDERDPLLKRASVLCSTPEEVASKALEYLKGPAGDSIAQGKTIGNCFITTHGKYACLTINEDVPPPYESPLPARPALCVAIEASKLSGLTNSTVGTIEQGGHTMRCSDVLPDVEALKAGKAVRIVNDGVLRGWADTFMGKDVDSGKLDCAATEKSPGIEGNFCTLVKDDLSSGISGTFSIRTLSPSDFAVGISGQSMNEKEAVAMKAICQQAARDGKNIAVFIPPSEAFGYSTANKTPSDAVLCLTPEEVANKVAAYTLGADRASIEDQKVICRLSSENGHAVLNFHKVDPGNPAGRGDPIFRVAFPESMLPDLTASTMATAMVGGHKWRVGLSQMLPEIDALKKGSAVKVTESDILF